MNLDQMISSVHQNLKLNHAYKNFSILFYCPSILVVVIIFASVFVIHSATELSNNEFDHLIFTQRWLPSSCYDINKKCKRSECCKLPGDYKVWSIHGLWPQYKNTFGPFFCNKSITFNATLIDSVRPALDKFWPNIEKRQTSTSFWKYEWLKHGSCAAVLEKLNTEFKYFNTSLNLFEKVNMNKLFQRIKTIPNNHGVNVTVVFNKLRIILEKNPFIHCVNEINGEVYLSEIRLCYDLNLELMDCGTVNDNQLKTSLSHSVTNCPTTSLVKFPISPYSPDPQNNAIKNLYKRFLHRQNLYDLLKIVRFLLWVSL